MIERKLKLAILASGAGTTGEPIFDKAVVIVTNNPDAGVIEKAQGCGIPVQVMPRKSYQVDGKYSPEKYGEALIEVFQKYGVDFISQNGWAILTPRKVIDAYRDRIANVHPAPLDPGHPGFGGKGMHGLAVHSAVLNFARAIKRPFETEVTIHEVWEEYDRGPLLAYTAVEIKPNDTPESLQERVKEAEKRQNIDFWNQVADTGKLVEIQRPSRLIFPGEERILEKAKAEAILAYPHG